MLQTDKQLPRNQSHESNCRINSLSLICEGLKPPEAFFNARISLTGHIRLCTSMPKVVNSSRQVRSCHQGVHDVGSEPYTTAIMLESQIDSRVVVLHNRFIRGVPISQRCRLFCAHSSVFHHLDNFLPSEKHLAD